MTTVAEGVESAEEWDLVRDLGVDVVQGYHLARPMPEPELVAWLESIHNLVQHATREGLIEP